MKPIECDKRLCLRVEMPRDYKKWGLTPSWLTLGQGARMAKLDQYAFGMQLAERNIPRHYSVEDAEADVRHARGQ